MFKQSEYNGIIDLINKYSQNNKQRHFLGKITEFKGFFVDISIIPSESDKNAPQIMQNIPIFQNPQIQLDLKVDMIGIVFNLGFNCDNLHQGDFYIFLPFLTKEEYIKGLALRNKENEIILEEENTSFNTPKQLSIKNKVMQVENEEISINATKSYAMETAKLEIIGKSEPIKIGNSIGTLKDVVDSLFMAMDALSQGMTGPSTNPAAYTAQKVALQQKINQILG